MDDTPAKENPAKDFNKLDLSQLQGFSFGTQWSQDKTSAPDQRDRSDRPRRDSSPERREGGNPADRRDRRTFRKPSGEGDHSSAPAHGAQPGSAPADSPVRREYSGDRGPRREYQGGPRREGPGGAERGGPRYGGGYGGRSEAHDRGPYDSPHFSVAFYPEDTSFNALAKTIRTSCRTIELFEIARTVIGKVDRFVVVLARKAGAAAESSDGVARQPIYLSVPDGLPFETEGAAIAHVFSSHLDRFFDSAEVEVDPPKGNFQVINKCGVTGELLGPPNYHRYTQIVQQHFAAKVPRLSFDAFRSRIETVRDPEVIAQWLEKMKKTTRYTWKSFSKAAAPVPVATTADAASPVPEAAAAEVAAQEGSTTPESTPALTFDSFEDARAYLLANAKDKVVRAVETARLHGKLVETMPDGEIRRAIEGALERQRRFPLDTANALRGRLRREHFTIFKKGSKGVSYVCAVKRKFRVPGQTFADSISNLITFVEAHPMIRASELSAKFLGIELPAAKAVETAPTAVDAQPAAEGTPAVEATPAATKPEPVLTIDQRAMLSRMQGDLRWLVTEGYVTEFIDGRLFAPPPMVEARKKEVESEEHDPENFPEAPPVETVQKTSVAKFVETSPAPAPAAPSEAPAASTEAPAASTDEPPAPTDEPEKTAPVAVEPESGSPPSQPA